jgi:2-methylisocitrate lyase-like PEP mutase family enzyme
LVGASIEDATGIASKSIYDFKLSVERIKTAVEAKNTFDFPFTLTARSENFVHGHDDLGDTIKRLQSYQEAGADVLYAPDLRNYQDIASVIQSINKPLNVMAHSTFTVSELEKIGVKRISLGSLLNRAALGEFIRSAREIKEKGTCTFENNAFPFSKLMEVFNK